MKINDFDEDSYKLFRQQLGKEIFKIPIPYKRKQLALCISGGLDSSVLCIIYSKQRKLRTYSIGFKGMNEFKSANKIAETFKTKHKNITISKTGYIKNCKELIKLKKEPLQVPNETLLYVIAKTFKRDIKNKKGVLLSGEGADELFGGYTQILNTIPSQKGDLLKNYLQRTVYNKGLWIWLNRKKEIKFTKIFKENDIKISNYDRVQNWLKRLHLPTLLQRARSINFVKGIKVDMPFTHPESVMFAEALPRTMRVNKTFLRVCFGELLPRETMEQEKTGFALPIDLNSWQKWNLEIYEKGKSKIIFWKE